ncbi:chitin synthase-domain-containing protein [Sphaerosporella brunnea]|uniref:Chitin synthase n=1 Tax=Sphaerosporella brunnea TaxID=1250544 RepID=A0A5J5EXZ1_9PEZI|nr:chitin synthase-domain-containing protein [Sphaerosporella brunnea]
MAGRGRDPYSRLDFDTSPPHPDDSDYESPPHSPHNMYPPHRANTQSVYDPPLSPHHRTPSPMGGGYELEDQHVYRPQRQNTAGYPSQSAHMPTWPDNASNTLLAQPTYSVSNLPHSLNEAPPMPPSRTDMRTPSAGDPFSHSLYPEDHRDDYHSDPYQPQVPGGDPYVGNPFDNNNRYDGPYDDDARRPILETPETVPTPLSVNPDSYFPQPTISPVSQSSTPAPGGVRRWKTVKKVALFKGNLVLDCPVPQKLLQQLPNKTEREFTHMRYSAATCDPSKFVDERFTLRQQLFQKPRQTELFIVVTMYNEDDKLFARTMSGVFKNIAYLCSRTKSQTWGEEAWKKVVVCVVSDGRGKINPRTRSVLAGMGCYQEGIAKTKVNEKDVTAHIYEYTTQVGIELDKNELVKIRPQGKTPVQILFCLKEQNQKKINSHRWFFQAFGPVLKPNICVLIDAGTRPGGTSIYSLWKAFDINPQCAGACGEIKAMLGPQGRYLWNPLIATQNFEYKMSNILDKPLESVFGFISVLPGAFSAYRYEALQNDVNGEGPLHQYFKGETLHGADADAGIFTKNMYLAEDRILCFELVTKRKSHWILQYVKSSHAETDVPDEISELILQRRRWLNGSFFAAVYALVNAFDVWRSDHSLMRKLMFHVEFLYQTISMLFSWFAIGNFFLVFRILTSSLGDSKLGFPPGKILSVVFEWIYLGVLVTCFVMSLGNKPKGSKKLYLAIVVFWAILMVYLMFAAIFISVKSVQSELKQANGQLTVAGVFKNELFRDLIVSLCSTYILYFVASFMFFEPWHMFTSFLQYLLLSPSYINVLNIYAFCNVHDISWGTKGPDVPPALGEVKTTDGKAAVNVPSDDKDLDEQYEAELLVLSKPAVEEVKDAKALAKEKEEKQEAYYAGVRSGVVLSWMFTNFALAAAILNSAGLDRLTSGNEALIEAQRSKIYLAIILWTVAALSAFRFLGASWFLILRLFRGV